MKTRKEQIRQVFRNNRFGPIDNYGMVLLADDKEINKLAGKITFLRSTPKIEAEGKGLPTDKTDDEILFESTKYTENSVLPVRDGYSYMEGWKCCAKWMRSQLQSLPKEPTPSLYAFLYNPMIHESSSATMSIHLTRKGAEMAMEFHKQQKLTEHLDQIKWEKENTPEGIIIDETFGKYELWSIEEFKVLP